MPIDTYKGSVGDIIRKLRSRAYSKNFIPLSQLDLALKIGWENPSTLSRIESGKVIPSRKTLIRICKALELTSVEINFLLKKFEYDEYIPRVTNKYLEKMIKLYKQEVDLYPFPAMLEYSRKFIYMNPNVYKFLLDSNAALRASAETKTYLEIIFFAEYGLKDKLINWKEFAEYVAINSNVLMPIMLDEENTSLDDLLQNDLFSKMSKLDIKLDINRTKLHNIPFIYNHPVVGEISFLVSQFPLHFDNRFYLMQFIPATSKDLKLFTEYVDSL